MSIIIFTVFVILKTVNMTSSVIYSKKEAGDYKMRETKNGTCQLIYLSRHCDHQVVFDTKKLT